MGLIDPLLLLLLLTRPLPLLLLLPAIQHAINAFKCKRYTTLALCTPKFTNDSALYFNKFNIPLDIKLRLKRGLVGLKLSIKIYGSFHTSLTYLITTDSLLLLNS
jgi:hypothetical protein